MAGFLAARDEMIDAKTDAENNRSKSAVETNNHNGETVTSGSRNQYATMRPVTMPETPGQVDTIIPCLNIVLLIWLGGAPTARMIPKSRLLFSKARLM